MIGLIVLIGVIIIIILGIRHGDKKIKEAEDREAAIEKERERRQREREDRMKKYTKDYLASKKVKAITTPVRSPMPAQSKLPSMKIEQRTTTEYTTTRAEDSGSHSSDDFALGLLVGHLSSISSDSSSYDDSQSSSDSSGSDSSSSSSDDN